jgi:hypothetical protein
MREHPKHAPLSAKTKLFEAGVRRTSLLQISLPPFLSDPAPAVFNPFRGDRTISLASRMVRDTRGRYGTYNLWKSYILFLFFSGNSDIHGISVHCDTKFSGRLICQESFSIECGAGLCGR